MGIISEDADSSKVSLLVRLGRRPAFEALLDIAICRAGAAAAEDCLRDYWDYSGVFLRDPGNYLQAFLPAG